MRYYVTPSGMKTNRLEAAVDYVCRYEVDTCLECPLGSHNVRCDNAYVLNQANQKEIIATCGLAIVEE